MSCNNILSGILGAGLSMCIIGGSGCKKFVQVPPPETQLETGKIFSGDNEATAAMLGLYNRAMVATGSLLNGGVTLYSALSADECTIISAALTVQQFANNALASDNSNIANLYGSAYNCIYNANTMLENLPISPNISTIVRRRLTGESLFMRALVYSYLVELFGPAPLVTGTSTKINATKARTSVDSVYGQIVEDLSAADTLLDTSYAVQGTTGTLRTRPNRWAARALLSRIHLYRQQWAAAEADASAVIASGQYILEASTDSVFFTGSREALWQLQPVSTFTNTADGFFFLPVDNAQARPNYVLSSFLKAAFEAGDRRRSSWVGDKVVGGISYSYPAKYKVRSGPPYTEYNVVLRLAEIYLIRAEARAEQGHLPEALADLNRIRLRAGLSPLGNSLSQGNILAAVARERRIELMAEWGHRWADLKRTGAADSVLGTEKPGWTPNAALYPIPETDMLRNTNLKQNAGY